MSFIPLNVISNYSLLQSGLTISDYLTALLKDDYKAAGICDPGFLFGAPHFSNAAFEHGIKPLIGITIVYDNVELVFYIKNSAGYFDLLNLLHISEQGLLNDEHLKQLTSNLITIVSSKYVTLLTLETQHQMRDFYKRFALITNEFYLGLERYDVNDDVTLFREFASYYNYNIVAFPLIKYVTSSDALNLEIATAVKEGTNLSLSEQNITGPYYLRSNNELLELYTTQELVNTTVINNAITFDLRSIKHPFALPNPHAGDPTLTLREKTHNKLDILKLSNKNEYVQRLNKELKIITNLKYETYFLVVADYVNYAKNAGILVGYGRGSAAGSLVSYLLGITSVDPLKHNLLFERFLNPERQSMPDIDLDFMDTRREEILAYLRSKYGPEHVAQIVTFQTNAAKSSLRDVGRVFEIAPKYINTLVNGLGYGNYNLRDSYRKTPTFRQLIDSDKYYLDIVRLASKIEGMPRQTGMHAAGIILDKDPLYKSLPLFMNNEVQVSQYEMTFLESQGYLKMDILGLANLTTVENVLMRIKQTTGKTLDFYEIPYDDPSVYKTIATLHTAGLFQLESAGMKKALAQIKPSSFKDVTATLALFRPGPIQYIPLYVARKEGREKVTYLSDDLKLILQETYGIIVYQEQIMQIAVVMAGFSLSSADLFRRAISKKDDASLQKLRESFINGALKNGYKEIEAKQTFDDIIKFADYGFNKAHSVAYAMLTCVMAFLKTYYPHAFYCELLTSSRNDSKKYQDIITELKDRGIKLLLPSVNKSNITYQQLDNDIILPLTAINGISRQTADLIITIRNGNSFNTFANFFARALAEGINVTELIALIEAGALDEFNVPRAQLKSFIAIVEPLLGSGLFSEQLFADIAIEPVADDPLQTINLEMERLGLAISANPFTFLLANYKNVGLIPIGDIKNGNVKTYGMVKNSNIIRTKTDKQMMFATITDFENEIELVVFPEYYERYVEILTPNSPLLVTGNVQTRDDRLQLVVSNIERLTYEQ